MATGCRKRDHARHGTCDVLLSADSLDPGTGLSDDGKMKEAGTAWTQSDGE
jgi:hypothetical protein